MKITSKFFDDENWSLYASLQTMVILAIMRIGIKDIFTLRVLVLASIISMMSGKVVPRLIYSFFLCLMVWSNSGEKFYGLTLFTILATFVSAIIPRKNKVYNVFYENKIAKTGLWIGIWVWLLYMPYLIYKKAK